MSDERDPVTVDEPPLDDDIDEAPKNDEVNE